MNKLVEKTAWPQSTLIQNCTSEHSKIKLTSDLKQAERINNIGYLFKVENTKINQVLKITFKNIYILYKFLLTL